MVNEMRIPVMDSRKSLATRTRFASGSRFVFLLVWLLGGSVLPMSAQTYLQNVGVPSFTTQIPVESGFINAVNGNLHLEIPLGAFPQRGEGKENVALVYDSAIWSPFNSQWNLHHNIGTYAYGWYNFSWRLVTSADPSGALAGSVYSGYCSKEDDYEWVTYSPFIYVAPDGTQHSFPATTVAPLYPGICGGSGTPNATAYASDGSGYYISITNYTNATVYAPDGTAMAPDGAIWPITVKTDPNGNQYTWSNTGYPSYQTNLCV